MLQTSMRVTLQEFDNEAAPELDIGPYCVRSFMDDIAQGAETSCDRDMLADGVHQVVVRNGFSEQESKRLQNRVNGTELLMRAAVRAGKTMDDPLAPDLVRRDYLLQDAYARTVWTPRSLVDEVLTEQGSDPHCKQIRKILAHQPVELTATEVKRIRRTYIIDKDGNICRYHAVCGSQYYVSLAMRSVVISILHDLYAHPGSNKLYGIVLKLYHLYWPKMVRDIRQATMSCECPDDVPKHWDVDADKAFAKLKAALIGLPGLAYPDFREPFQICCGASNQAIGGVLELFKGDHSDTVQARDEEHQCRCTLSTSIATARPYQGQQFESAHFRATLDALGISKSRTTIYHSAGDGLVERLNGTILSILRRHCCIPDWPTHLPALMFKREPPADFIPITSAYSSLVFDTETYGQYVARVRAYLDDEVDQAVTHAAARYTAFYDRKAKPTAFFPNARVFVRVHVPNNKLAPRWEGDWYIVDIIGSQDSVRVLRFKHAVTGELEVINVDHVRLDPVQPHQLSDGLLQRVDREAPDLPPLPAFNPEASPAHALHPQRTMPPRSMPDEEEFSNGVPGNPPVPARSVVRPPNGPSAPPVPSRSRTRPIFM
ncbi:retrovirus polyprotein, putative [Perkinsus marinus ATCC 50983]|uniref:Retrovirus polyprotein, putative n=1 Tax=Perkinsus marinus (strain ATCC 50983 / TXsc) TaxID=423536 RepID=C5LXV8_PERM5|nr:retrovirus polyprotein, putative [Perkinsus marinus ATCC 50983]EEQ98433.1 retrovirus polyprotein, putative [Perkinsus marinus ATCC 50983]|eukprot:XP_002765716.1 retrovirus polyprotein, putative [Perkinsus marinus ATCC 50983]